MFMLSFCYYYWRASDASETLYLVMPTEAREIYIYVYIRQFLIRMRVFCHRNSSAKK